MLLQDSIKDLFHENEITLSVGKSINISLDTYDTCDWESVKFGICICIDEITKLEPDMDTAYLIISVDFICADIDIFSDDKINTERSKYLDDIRQVVDAIDNKKEYTNLGNTGNYKDLSDFSSSMGEFIHKLSTYILEVNNLSDFRIINSKCSLNQLNLLENYDSSYDGVVYRLDIIAFKER